MKLGTELIATSACLVHESHKNAYGKQNRAGIPTGNKYNISELTLLSLGFHPMS